MKQTDYFLKEAVMPAGTETWISLLLLMLLMLYALARLVFPRYWHRFALALIYPVEGDRLFFEQNVQISRLSAWLMALSLLSVSLFLFIAVSNHTSFLLKQPSGIRFLVLLSGMAFFTWIKYAAVRTLGHLFGQIETANLFNHQWLTLLIGFGFFMMIWTFGLLYFPVRLSDFALVGGLITLIILFIMSALKGVAVLRRSRISLLYGILYLCTLEILPVFLIVRRIIS